jgi:hypothetical protein
MRGNAALLIMTTLEEEDGSMTMVGRSHCQVLVPVIIGVPSRGEGETKSGLSEAFGEKDWRG